jgi:hypothetical protein
MTIQKMDQLARHLDILEISTPQYQIIHVNLNAVLQMAR